MYLANEVVGVVGVRECGVVAIESVEQSSMVEKRLLHRAVDAKAADVLLLLTLHVLVRGQCDAPLLVRADHRAALDAEVVLVLGAEPRPPPTRLENRLRNGHRARHPILLLGRLRGLGRLLDVAVVVEGRVALRGGHGATDQAGRAQGEHQQCGSNANTRVGHGQ